MSDTDNFQTCNMDERTNEEKLQEKCPPILWGSIRQYARTCDNALIPAFHYKNTMDIVRGLQQQNTALQQQVKDLQAENDKLNHSLWAAAKCIESECERENSAISDTIWFSDACTLYDHLRLSCEDYANTLSSKGG